MWIRLISRKMSKNAAFAFAGLNQRLHCDERETERGRKKERERERESEREREKTVTTGQ